RALARPHLSPRQRLALHFGLAHALDGRGRYDAAAEHMQQGNALCRELWEKQGQGYEPQAHTALVDRLIAAFTPEFFARVRGWGRASWHRARLNALNATADRVVDKLPDNYLHLGLIATLFPRARIIHCRRDPRDVAVSCWMTNFRHIRWAADPEHIAARF